LKKINISNLLVLPALFSVFSCSQENKLKNFEEFSSEQKIVATQNCDEDCVDLKKEFRYVVYVGEKIYCYWDLKKQETGLDYSKKASELENLITSNISQTQYFNILTKWASSLHDGHVNAMLKDNLSDIEFYKLNLRLEVLAPGTDHETLIVSDNTIPQSNLKVGTVIKTIQGQDWKVLAEKAEIYTSGSTVAMRRRQVGNAIIRYLLEIEGPKAVTFQGTYTKSNNTSDVTEIVPRNLALFDGQSTAVDTESTGLELIKSSILNNNIGYLRIDGFSGSQMRKLLDQALSRLQNTDGLIIDVRKNGGGDLSGDVVLARLISKNLVRFSQRVISSDMLQALRPSILFDYVFNGSAFSDIKDRFVAPSKAGQYTKPIVVLTSPFCFSACDTFVSAIKENKLGLVIGESTGGGTGNPLVIELPVSENSFRYSVAQGFKSVSKEYLEGSGTMPDVVIEPTVEERVAQKDLQLEKTAQFLLSKMTNQSQQQPVVQIVPEQMLQVQPAQDIAPYEIEFDRIVRRSAD